MLCTDPNVCKENLKPCWEEIQDSGPFTKDLLISILFICLAWTLISGLDSLEGSRTPGLQALPAIAGLEVTHAEGKTMGDVSGHEHPSHRGVGGC